MLNSFAHTNFKLDTPAPSGRQFFQRSFLACSKAHQKIEAFAKSKDVMFALPTVYRFMPILGLEPALLLHRFHKAADPKHAESRPILLNIYPKTIQEFIRILCVFDCGWTRAKIWEGLMYLGPSF